MKLAASSKSALFAGALAAAVFSCASVARAENMRASYRVSLIGLPIGVAVASSSVEDAHYKVNLNVRLTGVAALVSNLKMALASSGDYEEGAIAPSAYATTASNSRETRTLRMALSAGTVRQVQYSPQWEEDKSPEHVPLTDAAQAGHSRSAVRLRHAGGGRRRSGRSRRLQPAGASL